MPTRRQFIRSAVAGGAVAALAPVLAYGQTDNPVKRDGYDAPASAPTAVAADGIAPAGTIDWHNHWVSPRSAALLAKIDLTNAGPRVPGAPFPSLPRGNSTMLTGIDQRLEHLAAVGVDRQVICWATTTGWDAVLTADQAKPVWSAFNEDLSDLTRRHPDKFSGYAVVPTSDIDWAAEELDRAYSQLGLIGAVLPVGALQTLEGAKALTPIFDVTEKYKGILYLHSGPAYHTVPGQTVLQTPLGDAPSQRYNLEWSATYARGVVTLTQTDFLDKYPNTIIHVAMLGGQTPFLFSALTTQQLPEGAPDPLQRLRRVYLDASTTTAPHTLDLAVRTIGADRILFGSDFGAVPSIAPIVSAVRHSTLTEQEQHQVFVDNGRILFAAKGQPRGPKVG